MRARLSYANVTATLALLVALGGSVHAAIQLPRNSVGAKHIKAEAVRSSEVKNRSLLPRDLKGGGLAGFAYVRFDSPSTLEVEYGLGVTEVASTLTAGEYDVTVSRRVANCVAFATPTIGWAQFYDGNGNPRNTSFAIALFCR